MTTFPGHPAATLAMRPSVASASTDDSTPAQVPARPLPPRASAHANAAVITPARAAPASSWLVTSSERFGATAAASANAAAATAAAASTRGAV